LSTGSLPESEVHEAEQKFEESKQRAEAAMHNLIENEVQIDLQIFVYIAMCLVNYSWYMCV